MLQRGTNYKLPSVIMTIESLQWAPASFGFHAERWVQVRNTTFCYTKTATRMDTCTVGHMGTLQVHYLGDLSAEMEYGIHNY